MLINSPQKNTNLVGYKILSRGTPPKNLKIQASATSKKAIEKINEAGGEIILPSPKKKKKEDKSNNNSPEHKDK